MPVGIQSDTIILTSNLVTPILTCARSYDMTSNGLVSNEWQDFSINMPLYPYKESHCGEKIRRSCICRITTMGFSLLVRGHLYIETCPGEVSDQITPGGCQAYPDCVVTLRWRHNDLDAVSNHQPYDCLLSRLFRHRSKETSKLRVTGLYAGNSPVTGEFPAQMASNAELFFHLMTSSWYLIIYLR